MIPIKDKYEGCYKSSQSSNQVLIGIFFQWIRVILSYFSPKD